MVLTSQYRARLRSLSTSGPGGTRVCQAQKLIVSRMFISHLRLSLGMMPPWPVLGLENAGLKAAW